MAYLIVIEGTDGSGKQTQTNKLLDYFNAKNEFYKNNNAGYKVVEVIKQSFPNYESASSSTVKMYLGGELGDNAKSLDAYQASVLFSVDRLCTMKKLEQYVKRDDVVILLDRYVQSNMLHQASKIKNTDEVDKYLDWLDHFEFGLLKLPRPNQVIFLDMPVEMSKKLANNRAELKTGNKKDIHESDESHLTEAYNNGKYVAKKLGWTVINCIDNQGNLKTIDDIHGQIVQEIENFHKDGFKKS